MTSSNILTGKSACQYASIVHITYRLPEIQPDPTVVTRDIHNYTHTYIHLVVQIVGETAADTGCQAGQQVAQRHYALLKPRDKQIAVPTRGDMNTNRYGDTPALSPHRRYHLGRATRDSSSHLSLFSSVSPFPRLLPRVCVSRRVCSCVHTHPCIHPPRAHTHTRADGRSEDRRSGDRGRGAAAPSDSGGRHSRAMDRYRPG